MHYAILFAVCLGTLFACSSSDDQQTRPADIQSLKLSSENLTVTEVNTELSLSVFAIDDNSATVSLADNIVWQSSDESIAIVDSNGKVTTRAVGKVTLSASYGGLSDSIIIDVTDSRLSIRGKLRYQDKKYDASGFSANFLPTYNNIRYATVDLLDTNGTILETTASDLLGQFQFGHIIPEQYTIRVLAQVANAPAEGFSVRNWDDAIYSITKASVADQTSYDIKVASSSPAAAAFNMLDVFVSAAEYSRQYLQVEAKALAVFWQPNEGESSYYCSGYDRFGCQNGEGIYVMNQSFDTDEYDDDVLLHEFGHFIMKKYFIDDSPGGCHAITDNDLDLRVAWSEGWGTFFASSVKSNMLRMGSRNLSSNEAVTSYVDTYVGLNGNSAAQISYDIISPPFDMADASNDSFYYASSEYAVSNILWGVAKVYGAERIRDVLSNYFPTADLPTNLASFWQGLLRSDLLSNGEIDGLLGIFNDRKVFYQQDAYEEDDYVADANLIDIATIGEQDHFLYKDDLGADVDVFALDVQAGQDYVVATSDLRNGIDTLLRIVDENDELVVIDGKSLENDDADPLAHFRDDGCGERRYMNTLSALASKVSFTADISTRYYVKVSHIPTADKVGARNAGGATGPYGTYRLKIE
ncbi:MAG TPA: hypothetical protein ENK06_07830 [Gammaproteobacteria bacterium]|nr:hypothetical protein [Gammaproteobacteria bacterium]